jgi:UDP-N-acetylglucosamine:LPS N-acetylglucosamine transferase
MLKTFDVLSKLNGIQVVIKPHTRSGEEAKIYENLAITNVSGISSVELCEWADVMLVIGSSILIETLLQGKPVLYLKYLHENTTLYEEIGACWTVQNDNELSEALLALQTHKNQVPYSQEQVDRFLSEIIYGGLKKRDVLGDYEQFIVNTART